MSTTSTAKATRVATLLACSLASFMVGLDALVVTTVLPNIRHDFSAGIDNLSWVVNAYALAFAVSILAGSMLGDRFGRRRMLTVGVALFAVASASRSSPTRSSESPRSPSATPHCGRNSQGAWCCWSASPAGNAVL